jgi:hypothetical protein
LREPEGEPLRLPPGYRLDKSDPDVWALRRAGVGGWWPTLASKGPQRRP